MLNYSLQRARLAGAWSSCENNFLYRIHLWVEFVCMIREARNAYYCFL